MRVGVPALLVAATLALAASATAAPPLPGTKTAKERAAWRAILHWPSQCEQDWRTGGHPDNAGVELWQAPGGKHLVAVTCYLAAYQWTSTFYLVDSKRHATGPLSFHIYEDLGNGTPTLQRETKVLGVTLYTPKTRILSIFDKARGPGDCGIYSSFKLVGDRLPYVARAKTACDGKPPYDPRRWPKLPLPKP